MRVPPMFSEFFEWRWAPCVGLTAGSLTFVALALLLIPSQFDGAASASSLPNETAMLTRPAALPPRALFGASLPRNLGAMGRDSEQASPQPRHESLAASPPPGTSEPAAPPQRGFSPIIDRPEPPPASPPPAPVEVAPPPPQPPPPAPPPANVVIQQPQQPDADGPRREVTVQ